MFCAFFLRNTVSVLIHFCAHFIVVEISTLKSSEMNNKVSSSIPIEAQHETIKRIFYLLAQFKNHDFKKTLYCQ